MVNGAKLVLYVGPGIEHDVYLDPVQARAVALALGLRVEECGLSPTGIRVETRPNAEIKGKVVPLLMKLDEAGVDNERREALHGALD